MLKINGLAIKTPSSFSWSLMDISSNEDGRTQDATMHKSRVAQKRKLECSWLNPTRAEAAAILQAVNASVYMSVTYPDAMSGVEETRTFYVGDRSAPMQMWTLDKKIYSSVSFNFIEK